MAHVIVHIILMTQLSQAQFEGIYRDLIGINGSHTQAAAAGSHFIYFFSLTVVFRLLAQDSSSKLGSPLARASVLRDLLLSTEFRRKGVFHAAQGFPDS